MTTTNYLVGIGAQAIKFTAKEISPIAIEKIKALFSNRILVVGDKSCGKTSFIDYLKTGLLVNENLPRRRTLDITKSPSLNITMGENSQFQATLKTCIEIPGQNPTPAQDTIAINPDGLVIMTDLSKPINDNENWLNQYCEKLDDEWRRSFYEAENNKLKSIILVLNKVDKISNPADLNQYQDTLGQIVREKLNHARGNLDREDIVFLPCCCVNNPKGNEYINNVIYTIIMRLQK